MSDETRVAEEFAVLSRVLALPESSVEVKFPRERFLSEKDWETFRSYIDRDEMPPQGMFTARCTESGPYLTIREDFKESLKKVEGKKMAGGMTGHDLEAHMGSRLVTEKRPKSNAASRSPALSREQIVPRQPKADLLSFLGRSLKSALSKNVPEEPRLR